MIKTANAAAEILNEEDLPPAGRQRSGEIPEIDDARLALLRTQMQPVVEKNGRLYYICPVDPRECAFTWDPKTNGRAKGLKKIGYIQTLHTYGYQGFFKPSIAEVISQIPADILPRVRAFKTEYEGFSGGQEYHVGLTTLYEGGTEKETPGDKTKKDPVKTRSASDASELPQLGSKEARCLSIAEMASVRREPEKYLSPCIKFDGSFYERIGLTTVAAITRMAEKYREALKVFPEGSYIQLSAGGDWGNAWESGHVHVDAELIYKNANGKFVSSGKETVHSGESAQGLIKRVETFFKNIAGTDSAGT